MSKNSVSLQGRIKAHCRMSMNRLRLVQQKETAMAKQNRRELAQLMENGKISSAKIRVEILVREDDYIELLELLELECSLILARVAMLDKFDQDSRLQESLTTIIYASSRVDVKELAALKDILAHALTREFVIDVLENGAERIPPKILKLLQPEVPSEELATSYLEEIARAYNVSVPGIYEPPEKTYPEESEKSPGPTPGTPASNHNPSTGSSQPGGSVPIPPTDLAARFAALRK